MPRSMPRRLLLLVLTSLVLAQTALAWSYHTHRKICSDAMNRMPAAFLQRFAQFKDRILQGSTDPDTQIKDFLGHVYHVGGMSRECENRVKGLFDQGVSLLSGGRTDAEAAYTLGLISHYIADVNQPLHTAGSHVDPQESEYHADFEKEVQGQLSRIMVGEIRYAPVTNPLERLETIARAARPSYESIGNAYRTGNRYFDLQEMVATQYTASVQTVVDYWLGMLQAAGQPMGGTGPLKAETGTHQADGPSVSGERLPIDLNTATLEQLKDLPGIGEKKARAILEARPFKSIYDLAKIQPYGRRLFDVKLIERLSDRIRVSP